MTDHCRLGSWRKLGDVVEKRVRVQKGGIVVIQCRLAPCRAPLGKLAKAISAIQIVALRGHR